MKRAAVLALTLLAACTAKPDLAEIDRDIRASYPQVSHVQVEELDALLGSATPPLLLDTRSREEYEVSHLPGAHHAPDLATAQPLLEPGRPTVLYCSVGWRSAILTADLLEAGATDVHNLQGSIFAWANAGLPVHRDGAPVEEVHPFDSDWGVLLRRDLWTED